MSLSSRPPNGQARVASGTSALSDAMSAFNFQHYMNSVLTNALIAGFCQYTDIDSYFASNAGENQLVSALKEGAWTASVGQTGAMLRSAVPMLRVF